MEKIRIGLFGFGRTGKIVANEFLQDSNFSLEWVVRKTPRNKHKFASDLLGYEYEAGEIFSIAEIDESFFKNNPVDIIVDFASSKAVNYYEKAAGLGIKIISAISNYKEQDLNKLLSLKSQTAVLYSPNITLGINFLLIASQVLQEIAPHADIEIVEEHFREKRDISGTAKKLASILNLNEKTNVNSIRVGGIVGKHEIIFGLQNQTIRLAHDSISRAAFGQGAVFASKWLIKKHKGLYSMEQIITEMFKKHLPVY
ncbi:dihydrodipicolinate reductase [bacterium]|nr:dihydrodipicolinate reductase [bacterium]